MTSQNTSPLTTEEGVVSTTRVYDVETLAEEVDTRDRIRVLDLCCGHGGVGLAFRNLFSTIDGRVVGVDINDHNDTYPCEFIQADVRTLTLADFDLDRPVDLVWASPPCQAYSRLSHIHYDNPKEEYPTIPELNIREVCQRLGSHYVIENVVGCDDLRDPVKLTGSAFGLNTQFARLFETSFPVADFTDSPPDDAVTVGEDAESKLARAKHIPTSWSKQGIRSALPGVYIAYLASHCPSLPEIHPPGDPDCQTYAEQRTPDTQRTLFDH